LQLDSAHEIYQNHAVRRRRVADLYDIDGTLAETNRLLIQSSGEQEPARAITSVVESKVEKQCLERRFLRSLAAVSNLHHRRLCSRTLLRDHRGRAKGQGHNQEQRPVLLELASPQNSFCHLVLHFAIEVRPVLPARHPAGREWA